MMEPKPSPIPAPTMARTDFFQMGQPTPYSNHDLADTPNVGAIRMIKYLSGIFCKNLNMPNGEPKTTKCQGVVK